MVDTYPGVMYLLGSSPRIGQFVLIAARASDALHGDEIPDLQVPLAAGYYCPELEIR
jgi:hypothetical protein